MKILTWNVERPNRRRSSHILDTLAAFDADILILTETHEAVHPGLTYRCVTSEALPTLFDGVRYAAGENRTSIWTKYDVLHARKTDNSFTSACAGIATPFGSLVVYGTIIGIFGGRGQRFQDDLQIFENEAKALAAESHICLAGDFNTTFSGYVYPSHIARKRLSDFFHTNALRNITGHIPNNIDHIVMSESLLLDKKLQISVFNEDKKLSDHIGVVVEILQ